MEQDLKKIVKQINEFVRVFNSHRFVIILVALVFSIVGYFVTYFSTALYKAELRFIVKAETTASPISGMLGGIGSILGGGAIGSPLERTIELASSDRIIGNALLSKVNLGDSSEILANVLIHLNKFHEEWGKDTVLKSVIFSEQDTIISSMTFPKRKAIKLLEDVLIPKSGDGVITKTFDKKSGVVTISSTHENEDFAILLTNEVFNKLRDFYIEQMTTSAANNVLVFQRKVDSIKQELSKVQLSYARNSDQSLGLLLQEDKVELKKLAVKEQMLLVMYSEAQKNLEAFKFMNDSAIPSLTVIDSPYSPLKKIQRSKVLFTLGGFILGIILSCLFILIRIWYKNIIVL